MTNDQKFAGFEQPKENWSKLPHTLVDELHNITSESELKVIIYILRHTWGYYDSEKKITIDEFCNGRKRSDGSRIDAGCGITEKSARAGIENAVKHGYIAVEEDSNDLARIKRWYSLASLKAENDTLLSSRGVESTPLQGKGTPRTEKDTLERKDISFSDEKGILAEKPTTPITPRKPRTKATLPQPEPEATTTPSEHQQMFGALCTLIGWDYKTLTKEQAGQVAQALGVLKQTQYTIEDLRSFYLYWHNHDWRGKKGQYPTLSQVRSEIGKIKPAIINGNGIAPEAMTYTIVNGEESLWNA